MLFPSSFERCASSCPHLGPKAEHAEPGGVALVVADAVEEIEDARVVHVAELAVDVSAAEDGDDARRGVLGGLRDAERAIDGAGERRGDTDEVGALALDRRAGEVVDAAVDLGGAA